jgi:ribosome-associated translation inhibitor RaiA
MKIEINGQNFDLSQTSKTFLEKYLERMNRFLKANDIEEDVYDDIEERIAEKFMENLSDEKGKKITDKVVIDIINEI